MKGLNLSMTSHDDSPWRPTEHCNDEKRPRSNQSYIQKMDIMPKTKVKRIISMHVKIMTDVLTPRNPLRCGQRDRRKDQPETNWTPRYQYNCTYYSHCTIPSSGHFNDGIPTAAPLPPTSRTELLMNTQGYKGVA